MKTALTSDIEKAFLMISVQPSDRDALRFLWFDNINEDNPKVIPMRFKRVIFGVSSSPFLLNAEKLFNALYVDDVTTGSYEEDECKKIYTVSRKLMSEGGFNLRKWRTNSRDLQAVIYLEENKLLNSKHNEEISNTETKLKLTDQNLVEQKVLGLTWDSHKNTIKFNLDELVQQSKESETKRTILKSIAKAFIHLVSLPQ